MGPVKHVPPLTMLKYAEQPFPVTLTTVRLLKEEEEDSMGFASAEQAQIFSTRKPWALLEINLEFLSLEAEHSNDFYNGQVNALVMAHYIHGVAISCAQILTDSVGKIFVPKPIDSFLDKLFYRQLDIHDLIRTRVEKDGMEEVLRQLMDDFGFVVFQRKTTKNGASSVVLFGNFAAPDGNNGPLWVEVQQDLHGAKDTHIMEYEVARMVRSDRYQSFLVNDANSQELEVPRATTEEDMPILEYLGNFGNM